MVGLRFLDLFVLEELEEEEEGAFGVVPLEGVGRFWDGGGVAEADLVLQKAIFLGGSSASSLSLSSMSSSESHLSRNSRNAWLGHLGMEGISAGLSKLGFGVLGTWAVVLSKKNFGVNDRMGSSRGVCA